MSNGSILLHREHGLNPTITVCWLCGKDKNEIAFLGTKYKDKAPMHMCIDKKPCECCQKELEQFVFMIVCTNEQHPDETRTGELIKIKHEAFSNIFNTELPPQRIAFCGADLKEKLQSMMPKE